ncbi:MAG: helix-turn-helix domain-containing protein, partial [Nocardioidaceae bacterium]
AAQFKGEYGLTPKQAARVMRFEHSWDLLRMAPRRLADVAATTGYADQAHMTREWRDLAGYTPVEWRRSEFPFLQDHGDRG